MELPRNGAIAMPVSASREVGMPGFHCAARPRRLVFQAVAGTQGPVLPGPHASKWSRSSFGHAISGGRPGRWHADSVKHWREFRQFESASNVSAQGALQGTDRPSTGAMRGWAGGQLRPDCVAGRPSALVYSSASGKRLVSPSCGPRPFQRITPDKPLAWSH